MTVNKRTVLGVLTRAWRLQVAAKTADDRLAGKRNDAIVGALAASRREALAELLARFSPDELESACGGAGLRTKGQDSDENRTKHRFAEEWGRAAHGLGGLGRWSTALALDPGADYGVLEEAALRPTTKEANALRQSASAMRG